MCCSAGLSWLGGVWGRVPLLVRDAVIGAGCLVLRSLQHPHLQVQTQLEHARIGLWMLSVLVPCK